MTAHVLVAVPAHDEAEEIAGCLAGVTAAARHAVRTGACSAVTVGVALNRCTDATASIVGFLPDADELVVVVDETSRTVGGVRAGLVATLVAGRQLAPSTTWVFSTDADSRVPVDWISEMLGQVLAARASAAAGMVELRGWRASRQARADYDVLLAAGIDGSRHTHVYGANLAVRLDAYLRVGGFRPVHAEDQDLVDRLRLAGEHVATLLAPTVRTSAREPGRADAGLGALLADLRSAADR